MYTTTRILAILLVSAGAALLINSFAHRKYLCNSNFHTRYFGWKILFSLNIFFFIGYVTFLWELFTVSLIENYHLLVASIFCGGGIFVALVIKMSSMTLSDVRKIADQDRHNALHDALTGLPNRTLLAERINQAILHAKRDMCSAAVILLDLDRFKDVNDTLGHTTGDKLLKELAPRFKQCIREIDTIARIGGDEFAAVLPSTNQDEALKVADKFTKLIDQTFQIDQHHLNIGVSMGIAVFPEHGNNAHTLLQHADIVMYKAKRNAEDCIVYDIADNEYSINRLQLVSQLREAVRNKEFSLVYQPKMNLHSGKISSVEALIRWNSPNDENINPETFIPIIEHIGLMKDLTLWVVERALIQHQQWKKLGLDINIAVNISAKNLSDSEFPNEIFYLTQTTGTKPECLILEITESSMMHNPESALKTLSELAIMGVSLSIDDFGTGYSSLSYLKNLPASEVKIDKSFVCDILNDENDAVIVCATIGLAHNLGYRVVAEGVETQEVMDFIDLWGCDTAQGYHISRPLNETDLFNYVTHNQSLKNPSINNQHSQLKPPVNLQSQPGL